MVYCVIGCGRSTKAAPVIIPSSYPSSMNCVGFRSSTSSPFGLHESRPYSPVYMLDLLTLYVIFSICMCLPAVCLGICTIRHSWHQAGVVHCIVMQMTIM